MKSCFYFLAALAILPFFALSAVDEWFIACKSTDAIDCGRCSAYSIFKNTSADTPMVTGAAISFRCLACTGGLEPNRNVACGKDLISGRLRMDTACGTPQTSLQASRVRRLLQNNSSQQATVQVTTNSSSNCTSNITVSGTNSNTSVNCTSSKAPSSSDSSVSVGLIAIIVGSILGTAGLITLGYFLCCRRRCKKGNNQNTANGNHGQPVIRAMTTDRASSYADPQGGVIQIGEANAPIYIGNPVVYNRCQIGA